MSRSIVERVTGPDRVHVRALMAGRGVGRYPAWWLHRLGLILERYVELGYPKDLAVELYVALEDLVLRRVELVKDEDQSAP